MNFFIHRINIYHFIINIYKTTSRIGIPTHLIVVFPKSRFRKIRKSWYYPTTNLLASVSPPKTSSTKKQCTLKYALLDGRSEGPFCFCLHSLFFNSGLFFRVSSDDWCVGLQSGSPGCVRPPPLATSSPNYLNFPCSARRLCKCTGLRPGYEKRRGNRGGE